MGETIARIIITAMGLCGSVMMLSCVALLCGGDSHEPAAIRAAMVLCLLKYTLSHLRDSSFSCGPFILERVPTYEWCAGV